MFWFCWSFVPLCGKTFLLLALFLLAPPLNDLISDESLWRTRSSYHERHFSNVLYNQAREVAFVLRPTLSWTRGNERSDRQSEYIRSRSGSTNVNLTHARTHACTRSRRTRSRVYIHEADIPRDDGKKSTSKPAGFRAYKIKYPAGGGIISFCAIAQLKRNCRQAAHGRTVNYIRR